MTNQIKNLKKAAQRVIKAVKNKERIILYGDSDLDGAGAVIILKEAIKNIGGDLAAIYFPDREKEGYGISKTSIKALKKFSPALLISLDCGIGNFKEVKLAKKAGFKVIIIDHHEVLQKLPEADIIVDPKQKGDKYPFKGFAAAGLSLRLAILVLGNKMTSGLEKDLYELAALATIADMMPETGENETIIRQGVSSLEKSWRPGIKVLLSSSYLAREANLRQKISKIISLLNVRDADNKDPFSFLLFSSSSEKEAAEVLEKLLEKNRERRERMREIMAEVEEKISGKEKSIIFEGDSEWEYPLVSTVASILVQKYKKPIFLYKKLEKESLGSVRMPTGQNAVLLMGKCKKLLITYGGHPPAGGFRAKNKNLEKFESCLIKNLKEK